jgi:hypothetical protein
MKRNIQDQCRKPQVNGGQIRFLICICSVLTTLLACGCAVAPRHYDFYSGATQPLQDLAVLRVKADLKEPRRPIIRAIDGNPVSNRIAGQDRSDLELRLLPGRHKVRFGYLQFTLVGMMYSRFDQTITFDAVAGRSYEIHIDINDYKEHLFKAADFKWNAKLVEVETGKEFLLDADN